LHLISAAAAAAAAAVAKHVYGGSGAQGSRRCEWRRRVFSDQMPAQEPTDCHNVLASSAGRPQGSARPPWGSVAIDCSTVNTSPTAAAAAAAAIAKSPISHNTGQPAVYIFTPFYSHRYSYR